jgi:hypothetical protein
VLDGNDVSVSGDYSFPLSGIQSSGKGTLFSGNEWWHSLEYDIELDWRDIEKEAEYDIDIEVKSDFLTGQIGFALMYENKAGKLVTLGHGQ